MEWLKRESSHSFRLYRRDARQEESNQSMDDTTYNNGEKTIGLGEQTR